MKDWPPVDPNQARLVFYCLPNWFQEETKWMYERPVVVTVILSGEGQTARFDLAEKSALYVDVPAGNWNLSNRHAVTGLELEARPQQLYFLKMQKPPTTLNCPPVLMNEADALAEMQRNAITSRKSLLKLTTFPKWEKPLQQGAFNASDPPTEGTSRLTIIRYSGYVGSAVPMRIGLNGPAKYKLENKQYCTLEIPIGRQILTVICSPSLIMGLEDVYRLGLEIESVEGQSQALVFLDMDDPTQVIPVSEQQAREIMVQCTRAPGGLLKPANP